MSSAIRIDVLSSGLFTTIQDGGRRGWRHLGVGRSGPADRTSAQLANRLAGNDSHAALLEVTLGRLQLRALGAISLAVTGAPCPIALDGEPARGPVVALRSGQVFVLGVPERGLRTYIAIGGGVAATATHRAVLGSLSHDSLSGLGPPALRAGDVLVAGPPPPELPRGGDALPWASDPALPVAVTAGPHLEWFSDEAWERLIRGEWRVGTADRVAARLTGEPLPRRLDGEVPTIGLVRGAIQVTATGEPIVMSADHPVTGGYPVIAVTTALGADRVAQAGPGVRIRFTPHGYR